MSKEELNKLSLFAHYTVFAYPFLHDINEQIPANLSEKWQSWWARIEDDEALAYTLDSTHFFLPYIRNLIYPETSLLSAAAGEKYADWIKIIKDFRTKNLTDIEKLLPANSILRLTYKTENLSEIQRFTFPGKDGNEIAARFLWIDAVIFPSGIGFLLFKTELEQGVSSLGNLIEFNKSFCRVHPFNIFQTLPVFKFAENEEFGTKQLIEKLLGGFVSKDEIYTENEKGQTYGERCHHLSFAGIDFSEINVSGINIGDFETIDEMILYEYATSTDLYGSISNSQSKPSAKQMEKIKTDFMISNWEIWSGMALRDGVSFLAKEKNDFNRLALPFIIEDDYLPLYIYTLYQKYQLYLFADKLMHKGAEAERNLSEIRSLTKHFFTFRNKYWFNEITRKPQGNEIYQKFKIGLGVLDGYDLVKEEINDLKEFYEEKRNRKIQDSISVLTFIFVPLGAIIGLWGMNFIQDGTWGKFFISAGLSVFFPYLIYRMWIWWGNKRL